MDKHQDQYSAVARFVAELESIPWFRNIGRPLPPDAVAKQLRRWEDWPGPEEPAVFELSERQQALYDELMAESGARRAELLNLWDRVHKRVITCATSAVPYDPAQDSWHAPTVAVWQAALTAGLIALCTWLRRPVPEDLQQQWNWFVLGHWPSGYSRYGPDDRRGPLLVY
jgi:hypothetical protein